MERNSSIIEYRPRPGFQTEGLFSDADFLLTGGIAGPGKTFFLFYNALFDYKYSHPSNPKLPQRCYEIPGYTSIIFRRDQKHTEQLKRDATPLYESLGGEWSGQPNNRFKFKSGACIYIAHMHNVDDWANYRGWEIHSMNFDEIPEFEEIQVSSILPWLRSTKMNLRPRFTATCNPEGNGLEWVKRWWNVKCPCMDNLKDGYVGHNGVNVPFYKNEQNETVDKSYKGFKQKWHFIPGHLKDSYLAEIERAKGIEGSYDSSLARMSGGKNSPRYKALARGCWEVARGAFFSEFGDVHIIPDSMPVPGNWSWVWSGGHDFASSPTGDAAAYVLGRANENRDVIVEYEWFDWGKDVVNQEKEFGELHSRASFSHSGDDIFNVNQGSSGEMRSIAGQFREVGVDFLKADVDIMAIGSMIRSALIATVEGRPGCIYVRQRCVRFIADLKTLLADKKKLDEWDKEQRVKHGENRYHFDVFRAFTCFFAGIYSADAIKSDNNHMNPKRAKAIEEQEQKEEQGAQETYEL